MTDSKPIIPKSLQDALRNHQVIPFIGAGVSRAILKTPKEVLKTKDDGTPEYKPLFASWWEFLKSAADKLDEEKIDLNDKGESKKAKTIRALLDDSPIDYLDIAQRAHNSLSKILWYQLLEENFNKPRTEADEDSLELSRLVWNLGTNLLITTNIDKVLQWTCPNKDDFTILNTQSVEFAQNVGRRNEAKPSVVYLHGHIEDKDNIVFTQQQYDDFYKLNKYPAKIDAIRTLYKQKTIIFIGYSLDDQNTVEELKAIHQIFAGAASSYYVLLKKGSNFNPELKGIVHPLYYSDHGEPLNNLVKEMVEIAESGDEKKNLDSPAPIIHFPEPDKKPNPSNPPFNVPFASKGDDFVGRVGKMEEIKAKLDSSHRASIGQALSFTGMGGLGKTQLAVEYAWHYRGDYPNGVIWLTADQDIDSQLIRLSDEAVWLHPSSKSEDKILVAKNRLKTFDNCLIIFDNLEQFSAIEEYLPDNRRQVHLLATSREEIGEFKSIFIELLERDESEKLLLLIAERQPTDEAEKKGVAEILAELDDLPLAIELIGGYLYKRKGISFSDYAKYLKDNPLDTLDEKYLQPTFTKHDHNLVRTLKINDELLAATPYLREILNVLTWSGSSSMGISLLITLIVPTSEFQFREALEMAVSLKLLKKEAESERYAIHRLLAKVRQAEEKIEDKKDWAETTAKSMADWFQERMEEFNYLAEYEAEIEHLQEWQKLTERLSLLEQIRLYWLEGYPYYHQGKYQEFQTCVQKSLNLYQHLHYSDDSLHSHLLNDLGYTYAALGEYQEALEYLEKALEIRKEVLGEKHPQTAGSYNNVGHTYGDLGNHQQALEYLEKALEISKEILGEKHPQTATFYNNVGYTYGDLGNHQQALEYLEKALEIYQEILGEKHPQTATFYNNVGGAYGDLGNHQQALEYLEKALEISKEILGEKHPQTALSYNNVGEAYGDLGNHKQALEYNEIALEIDREMLGNSHPDTICYCKNLIMTYRNLGKLDQAERLAAEFLSYIPQNSPYRKYFEEVGGPYRKAKQLKKKRRR